MSGETHVKIRRSGAYGMAGAAVLFATLFLPMSTPGWYWLATLLLLAALTGAALFFNARERRAGLPRSVGFFVLIVLVVIFAVLTILPAIPIW